MLGLLLMRNSADTARLPPADSHLHAAPTNTAHVVVSDSAGNESSQLRTRLKLLADARNLLSPQGGVAS